MYLASKWSSTRMHRHMPGEVIMSVEHFAAFSAFESFSLLMIR